MICKEAWNENILVKAGTWRETAWGSPAHMNLSWAGSLPDSRKFSNPNQLTVSLKFISDDRKALILDSVILG